MSESSVNESRNLQGIIGAAEIAIGDGDLDVAEDALTEALGEVRRRKGGETTSG